MNIVAALKLGSPAVFPDRGGSTITSFEVSEDWEVVNIVVTRGILRWKSSVKLPLSAAVGWSDVGVEFACTSAEAFGREVPPVAIPARPLSGTTPIGLAGAALTGALVDTAHRRAVELLLRMGENERRIPSDGTTFDGKVLIPSVQIEAMPAYLSDREIERRVVAALASERALSPEERQTLSVTVLASAVTLRGNAGTRRTSRQVGEVTSAIEGVGYVRNEIVDDAQLEVAVARALAAAGIQRLAEINVRSSLGRISLMGHAPSDAIGQEAARVASSVPGVRAVLSQIEADTRAEAKAEP